MDHIQKLCKTLSTRIVKETNGSDEDEAVIAYGLFAILHTVLACLISLIIAAIFKTIITTCIITIVAMVLRKYSGGAHASHPMECTAVSLIVTVGGGVYAKHASLNPTIMIIVGIFLFIIAFYTIHTKAPVDSVAKPITRPEQRKMLKKKSYLVLGICLIIVCILNLTYLTKQASNYLVYCLCIYIGVGWQVFTLTKLGHQSMNKIDFLFNKLFYKGED